MSEKPTALDAVKIQARVVIPIVRALEREVGKERAHSIVGRAIAESYAEWQVKTASSQHSHPRDVDIEGYIIPEGSRVVHSHGSANRDERHYPDPDTYDARRNPVDTLAFDVGVHTCPGRTLASMEGHALFNALAARASKIELTGEPTRNVNNVTRGLSSLPIRIS